MAHVALVFAAVRTTEGWSGVSIVAGVILVALAAAGIVRWAIRVVGRR